MKYSFTATQKKAIKRVLGYGYVGKIKSYFDNNNVTNANNEPFSKANIRVLFNSQTTNELAYKKILELFDIKEKEQLKIKQQLKKIA
ncbi:hypothetical protein [Aurantibacter aestuarii]|uniref:Uncharacterized protein n=1 Tax=Aurantibacter aestuarii TaxID=1266046 RepID=A0A2T1NEL4_9FLAO|nr:hypothetical protein [Aurantibacter aestuarii]PSG90891.1 hypothetical protein C7H52_06355 [Aurantibacter aestuarii]